jgi:hypothetical protein
MKYMVSECKIEVREFFELEDFSESPAIKRCRELDARMGK